MKHTHYIRLLQLSSSIRNYKIRSEPELSEHKAGHINLIYNIPADSDVFSAIYKERYISGKHIDRILRAIGVIKSNNS